MALPCSRVPRGGRGILSSLWKRTRIRDMNCGRAALSLAIPQFPHISSHLKPSQEQSHVSISITLQSEGTTYSHDESELLLQGKPWTPLFPAEERPGHSEYPRIVPRVGGDSGAGCHAGPGSVGQAAPAFPTAASCCPISWVHLGSREQPPPPALPALTPLPWPPFSPPPLKAGRSPPLPLPTLKQQQTL